MKVWMSERSSSLWCGRPSALTFPFMSLFRYSSAFNSGEYVGSVGVLDFHRVLEPAFDAPELGWGVHPRHQGKGLAFEALSAALSWCDDALNAPRTVCMISPDNDPSIALARRAGYAPYIETTYKGEPVILFERIAA